MSDCLSNQKTWTVTSWMGSLLLLCNQKRWTQPGQNDILYKDIPHGGTKVGYVPK